MSGYLYEEPGNLIKREKKEEEINIVAVNPIRRQAIFGECKYRNEKLPCSAAEELLRKAELFGQFQEKAYVLFSKSGFTGAAREYAREHRIQMVELEEMYQ